MGPCLSRLLTRYTSKKFTLGALYFWSIRYTNAGVFKDCFFLTKLPPRWKHVNVTQVSRNLCTSVEVYNSHEIEIRINYTSTYSESPTTTNTYFCYCFVWFGFNLQISLKSTLQEQWDRKTHRGRISRGYSFTVSRIFAYVAVVLLTHSLRTLPATMVLTDAYSLVWLTSLFPPPFSLKEPLPWLYWHSIYTSKGIKNPCGGSNGLQERSAVKGYSRMKNHVQKSR